MNSNDKIFEFVRAVLNLFKAAPTVAADETPRILDNERNLTNGFYITERALSACPCVADENILKFIAAKFGYNLLELNQGFYKSFRTVADSTPQKILLNKLLHYMSTYGAEQLGIFDRELVYIPNDAPELPADAKPVKVTIIDAIGDAEISARANKLIMSGASLAQETLDDLITVIKFLGIKLNVDDVPNKELSIRLCELLNILPRDPAKFLRFMIYVGTGSTLLIKDKSTVDGLRQSAATFDGYFERYISLNGLDRLASVFHRFKPLWLAFKPHSKFLRATVNKMRKLADKYHKPVNPKFLERLTSAAEVDLDELKRELAEVTTYKKISLANAILYRMSKPEDILYSIRNGKAFVTDWSGNLKFDAQKVLDVIIAAIAEDIRPNVAGKKIFILENFSYAAPTSDKKFFGNIPYGSIYTFAAKSVVVGVHWLNVLDGGNERRIDLDLHMNGRDVDIGWQNDFDDKNFINATERKIIFSGDMTDAPIGKGGATEAYFVGESITDKQLVLNLNDYTYDKADNIPVPFKLILADVNQAQIDRQYLLDAHEIAFCVDNVIDAGEMFIGLLTADDDGMKKFCFLSRNMGGRIVARSDALTQRTLSALNTTFETLLSLETILRRAGAILDGMTADDCDINLDPAEVTKDTLLALLTK